mgnify:CR=1 FL=1
MNGRDAMAMLSLSQAARDAGGRLDGPDATVTGVSTDSRAVAPGELFVALAGERHDAHDFVPQARERGAAAVLVSRTVPGEGPAIVVEDTRAGLARLAAAWRARFALPVLALTGSNGKTTVKEMTASILAAHAGEAGAVLATEGNLNNDIGLPLMLLRLRAHHRFAVFEMGMNHAGEIDFLSRLAAPTAALVNNAQRAHVGLLGSVEAVARAKGEIYGGLGTGGVALVNADDAHAGLWTALAAGRPVVTFGFAAQADVRGRLDGDALRIAMPVGEAVVRLRVPGEHNARNAVAAAAAALALGAGPAAIAAGLEAFGGVHGRLERRTGPAGERVIDDTYNANPDSVRAAIDVLAAEPGRRVLVLGDMGELGEGAPALHAEVGAFAKARGIDGLVAFGPLARHAADAFGEGARHFADLAPAIETARDEALAGAVVLVKGSRSMRMERVCDAIAPEGGAHAA